MSVTMKWLPLALVLSLGTTAAVAEEAWQQQEQAREQQAQQDLASVSRELNSARAKLAEAQRLSKELASQFAANEKQLVELNTQWEQASGDMNDIFAVTRQGASDAVKLLSESAVEGQYPDRLAPLKTMAQDKQVPDRAALALLPATLLQEIRESGRVAQFNGKVLDAQGVASEQTLTRIGSFALLGDAGFLQPGAEGLSPVLGLPGSVLSAVTAYQGQEGEALPLDPSHGVLLDMLAQAPTFWQQVQQGGQVGAIIVLLAAIGLGIAGVRLWSLSRELGRVRRQLKSGEYHADNALGRVLTVADKHPELSMETLELRLDEAILQETPRLERGIGMVKVIAAIAPMLGLLGTVTGMIGTFQAITQFGTGDPKIMAGGISMALVTTVQGLVAAIPLILAHSLLQSRFTELSNVLEQQVAGILAERAESNGDRVERVA
ncbi:MotA/TolQ/ExbB proton channel family protein [Aeromonas caviae]|uniref:MotA/TolQ/ExbB proton channel family protein n=1 Tax=Aeromonas TaxID=642 RepID=UPI0002197A6B|nr:MULTISPECIES: MotA/TolQ/ExbB proton channel family protein [Aeromonas]MBL0579567.1 MotA/TolQ/ExbB proton channel family protein [Aeromonas caviae]MCE9862006.1 MotA/TolQ/ExbB proton channel family protein [Aeromonas caviae]MDU4188186.1 MotA/TolQ/ExbB proton channel family protein [Aeromonas sp.]MDX7864868.1 MotA/TolQ/ExbB proton channel family protein [Aeromonas caviae]NBA29886.1 MotA/TolQ/ExbB proton channel family protein [Aeromonas caviae]